MSAFKLAMSSRLVRAVFAVTFVLSFVFTSTITGASASVNKSSIGWSGSNTFLCLVPSGHGDGKPVILVACPDDNWYITKYGKIRRIGTRDYLGLNASGNTVLTDWRAAPEWVYGPGHTITQDGQFLTSCSGSWPFVASSTGSGCSVTWYIFTQIG